MDNTKVWYVTGASKGLGLALVKKLLAAGYKVAATSRNSKALTSAVGEMTADFLPLQVDLLNERSVEESIQKTVGHFGAIHVVVNNAGYGQLGALEELSDKESRLNFDVNVFGLLNVIRKVLPQLREQKTGHIFNIGSIGGYNGNFAGWGIYCATKFAVAGLTEGLAAELQPLGIFATVVYPGYFRTNFLEQDSLNVPARPIDAYQAARDSQRMHQQEINGHQPGDPDKAADVLIRVAESSQPPVHLFLGPDANALAVSKDVAVEKERKAWEAETTATNILN
ncbi:MAG: SDR family oxidoreductase [Bacteroidetes bacterium]|nr:SDR family oxidoreductase [Bacteroidota bacterium]